MRRSMKTAWNDGTFSVMSTARYEHLAMWASPHVWIAVWQAYLSSKHLKIPPGSRVLAALDYNEDDTKPLDPLVYAL